ncbi:MAG: hypothetical protein WCG91_04185 [Candidatus Shapirobacteria bacterium]
MIEINQYLKNLLDNFNPYIISVEDKKIIDRGLKNFITQKIFAKKFRKRKLDAMNVLDIENKIGLSIKRKESIHFIIFFGGYKHFWNQSAPESDWAEIFTLNFLSEWVAPVLASYEPGVVIEFVSEDWILERMDNYKAEDLEKYCQSFSLLIENFNKHLPKNFKFKLTRLGDKFNKDKMLEAVEEKLPEGYQRWKNLSEEDKEIELKRSSRSVILKADEDVNRVIESRIVELAYYDVESQKEFSGDYFTVDNYIYISFSFGLSQDNIDNWLTLGSTYASNVDFWVGRGVLEENNNNFVNRIVSREQYLKIKDCLQTKETDFGKIEIISQENWKNTIVNIKE